MSAVSPSSTKRRPQSHKPRGVCKYYKDPRGCFAGQGCKFLHGEPGGPTHEQGSSSNSTPSVLLTPYDQGKRCRFYANGYCKRGEDCWFKHVLDSSSNAKGKRKERVDKGSESDSDGYDCSICLEKPVTYGLLGGCGHIFCVSCIKQWRDPNSKSTDVVSTGNNKKCPMCRTPSNFITPSSVFVKHGTEEKDIVIGKYKESMAKVQCRYFQKTKTTCPFGKDCFYKHEKPDGTLHVFDQGASVWMRRYAARRRPTTFIHNIFTFSDSEEEFGYPFSIGAFPYLELLNPIVGGVDDTMDLNDGRQGTSNPPIEVSMGQIDVNSWNVVLDQAQRQQASDEGNGTAATPEADATTGTTRRITRTIHDISQSLEALTDAMNAGSLDRIEHTVQALQTRLRQEDFLQSGDSVERLQNLAEQMLASIDLLQTATATRLESNGSPTAIPPTPLDALMPATSPTTRRNANQSVRAVASAETGDLSEDNDTMPSLQSISNSSEEDYDDSEDEDCLVGSDAFERRPTVQLDPSLYLELAEASRIQVNSGRDGETQAGPTEEQATLPVPIQPEIDVPTGGPALEQPIPIVEPPYVTDGRGRVVWTSSSPQATPATNVMLNPPPSPSLPGASPSLPLRLPTPNSSVRNRAAPNSSSSRKGVPAAEAPTPSPPAGGFTTDGRGRVIGAGVSSSTAAAITEEEQATATTTAPPISAERSFLERMFDGVF